jgi:isopenicillin-N N-acyltransferase-like protein
MVVPHYLELSGDAHTRGRTHGGELREQVVACVEFYRSILGLNEDELRRRAALFERLIEAYSPSQAEEIRGIATGAGLPTAHLFAINARSELVPFSAGECTVLCSPQEGLLAQTWDWCKQLEELVTVLAITREDGHRMLTVTEPGIVGKIGLSSAAVGVCLNFLSVPRSIDGVPIHSLLREVLEAASLPGACSRLRQAGPGRGGNVMMLEASGEAFNFEFAGDHVDERPLPEPACHTNHCLYSNVPAGELEANSRARIARAGALLSRSDSPGIGELKDILSDREDEEAPICAPYHPLFGLELGTLCTVVMDLPGREIHFRSGSDPGAAFQVYGLPQQY